MTLVLSVPIYLVLLEKQRQGHYSLLNIAERALAVLLGCGTNTRLPTDTRPSMEPAVPERPSKNALA